MSRLCASIMPLFYALSTGRGNGILTAHLHQDLRIVGNYQLQRRIRGGGFGTVYIGKTDVEITNYLVDQLLYRLENI